MEFHSQMFNVHYLQMCILYFHYSDECQEKKAPLCPKLSQMAALLQGGEASADGSTVPSHVLLFTFSMAMLLALFH